MGLFVFWLVMAVIVAMIANAKGRSAAGWFIYGFFLWPIALVHALLIEKPDGRIPCPFCAESILPGAKICPICKKDLPERPAQVADDVIY